MILRHGLWTAKLVFKATFELFISSETEINGRHVKTHEEYADGYDKWNSLETFILVFSDETVPVI